MDAHRSVHIHSNRPPSKQNYLSLTFVGTVTFLDRPTHTRTGLSSNANRLPHPDTPSHLFRNNLNDSPSHITLPSNLPLHFPPIHLKTPFIITCRTQIVHHLSPPSVTQTTIPAPKLFTPRPTCRPPPTLPMGNMPPPPMSPPLTLRVPTLVFLEII